MPCSLDVNRYSVNAVCRAHALTCKSFHCCIYCLPASDYLHLSGSEYGLTMLRTERVTLSTTQRNGMLLPAKESAVATTSRETVKRKGSLGSVLRATTTAEFRLRLSKFLWLQSLLYFWKHTCCCSSSLFDEQDEVMGSESEDHEENQR